MFFIKWGLIAAFWGATALGVLMMYYAHDLPDISALKEMKKERRVTILADNGEVLANFGNLYGDYVSYQDIPKELINAVLATEDRRFFSHMGVDPWGLIRAAYVNYRAKRVVQGGSTITQQLAKIVFLSPDRTYKRKIQEMMLAFTLEKNLTKEQILTIYLNRVYMGSGLYGVSAAAKYYLGKPLQQITLPEAAMIAGLLKAPSRYSPTANSELSGKRAYQIIVNMEDAGLITKEQLAEAQKTPIVLETSAMGSLKDLYFADWVMEQLPDYINDADSDLVVKTTFNPHIQAITEAAVEKIMDANGPKLNASQAAVVVLSPQGKLLAMVGGRDYGKSPFNRAVKARRQPGSAFKLFVYLTAFENGYTPSQSMTDSPITIRNWQPKNYEREFNGTMSLREAFSHSVNTIAVKLSEQVGRANVIHTARKLGIISSLPSHPSIALGSVEVNLLELTGSYATVANQGYAVWPYGIESISIDKGTRLYEHTSSDPNKVASQQSIAYMMEVMSGVISSGTGKAAKLDRPAAGKTGTTSDFRDAWFIGFTADLVTGVWVGNDNNSAMKHVTGGGLPTQIWKEVMMQAHAGLSARALGEGNGRAIAEGAPEQDKPAESVAAETGEKERDSFWEDMTQKLEGGDKVEYTYPTEKR